MYIINKNYSNALLLLYFIFALYLIQLYHNLNKYTKIIMDTENYVTNVIKDSKEKKFDQFINLKN